MPPRKTQRGKRRRRADLGGPNRLVKPSSARLSESAARPAALKPQAVPFKVPNSGKPWLIVIFDETTRGTRPGKISRSSAQPASQRETGELRRELAATKESLQAIIEAQEATNEERKSANEEIESSNEELQSTNEELETLNEELSNRNLEVQQMNSDLNNLLASIQLPILMVDNDLVVRRATAAARNAFNILQSDVGRPISDFRPNVEVRDLEDVYAM